MKNLVVFSVLALVSSSLIGCDGGYSYSPPPPPGPGVAGGEEEDPNAGVAFDQELMQKGMQE